MINTGQQKHQSYPKLTIISIALMILVGAVIIFFDRTRYPRYGVKRSGIILGLPWVHRFVISHGKYQHGRDVEDF